MEAFAHRDLIETISKLDCKTLSSAYIIGSDTKNVVIWSISNKVDLGVGTLPVGLRVLGPLLVFADDASKHDIDEKIMSSMQAFTTTDEGKYAFVFEHATNTPRIFVDKPQACPLPVQVLETTRPGDFIASIGYSLLRCAFTLPLAWTYSTKATNDSHRVLENDLEQIQIVFEDPSQTYFELPSKAIFNQNGLVGLTTGSRDGSRTLRDVLTAADDDGVPTPKKAASATLDPIYGGVVHRLSYLQALSNTSKAAPALTIHGPHIAPGHLSMSLDAVLCLPLEFPVVDAVALLLERISDQINAVIQHSADSITCISSCQYPLRGGAQHPIHVWMINGEPMNMPSRETLHDRFFQPRVPLFRAVCQWSPHVSRPTDGALRNVHVGLSPSGVRDGTVRLVQGDYAYYHYMQQNVHDKGWGCAYRSLQTLASWLLLNHYTHLAVPSHLEIQDTLVKMGDKPRRFLGSTDWIGSMEVGFVLDERYGVRQPWLHVSHEFCCQISFRTIHCASGADVVDHARELLEHFESHGTPVMIGGAALALTLLGVAYNEMTGDASFLILDPHYTGADDLDAIQTKTVALEGYKAIPCSWRKPASAFAASSFYNLCLPQRPPVV
ncbi:Aste57867_13743 [Aphanomyces stellatus]|uniref:Aste57867_13743 protein n=1 Tax=Aphanomyces stellatus TaxID=120398 RepID=A0A485KZA0_9STRA|nr:hypothetical protein As57867_013693 [Aphanomyces stellatus]VFT90576.1 Aste57867_13743 [Aphanomyces stellatus]